MTVNTALGLHEANVFVTGLKETTHHEVSLFQARSYLPKS